MVLLNWCFGPRSGFELFASGWYAFKESLGCGRKLTPPPWIATLAGVSLNGWFEILFFACVVLSKTHKNHLFPSF